MGINDLKVGNKVVDYIDESHYNEANEEILCMYDYDGAILTYSSRDIETGQLYFNNLVERIDERDLHMIVPITEDLLHQLNNSKLSLNELYRQVGDQVIYYLLIELNLTQYYQSHGDSLGVPDEYYHESEDCLITVEDTFI